MQHTAQDCAQLCIMTVCEFQCAHANCLSTACSVYFVCGSTWQKLTRVSPCKHLSCFCICFIVILRDFSVFVSAVYCQHFPFTSQLFVACTWALTPTWVSTHTPHWRPMSCWGLWVWRWTEQKKTWRLLWCRTQEVHTHKHTKEPATVLSDRIKYSLINTMQPNMFLWMDYKLDVI